MVVLANLSAIRSAVEWVSQCSGDDGSERDLKFSGHHRIEQPTLPGREVSGYLEGRAVETARRPLNSGLRIHREPPRVYRRPQLLRVRGHDEQDDEQDFT